MTRPDRPATGAPIRVGYINLEGGPTISSPKYREGAELGVRHVNERLNGLGGHPIELVRCYTDGTAASSEAAARRLMAEGVSLAVRGTNTNSAEVPILTGAGIPYLLAYGVGPNELDTSGLFSLTMQDGGALAGLAAYARERGWQKVAMLPLGTPNISQFFDRFARPVYAKVGLNCDVIYVPQGADDPSPQLSAATAGFPDALLFHGDVRRCVSFLNALATLGIKKPVFLVGGCANRAVLSNVPASVFDNLYFLSPIDLCNTDADAQTFETALRWHDPDADPHSIHLRLGYLPFVTLARIFDGFTGQPTADNMMAAIRAARDVPLPFGRGARLSCDGSVIPRLASVCSPTSILHKVEGPGRYTVIQSCDVAPFYA